MKHRAQTVTPGHGETFVHPRVQRDALLARQEHFRTHRVWMGEHENLVDPFLHFISLSVKDSSVQMLVNNLMFGFVILHQMKV